MENRDKKSETLSQREKAQRDFLELKKMQRENADKAPKQPYENEMKPVTFKEKLSNFWYHNKVSVIVSAVIIAAVTFICVQCALKPAYDLTIVIYDNRYVSDMYLENMSNYFKEYCDDFNKDGEVNVMIVNCTYEAGKSSAQYQQTVQQKLQSLILTNKTAMVFITSEDGLDYLQGVADDLFFELPGKDLSEDFYEKIETYENLKLPQGLRLYRRNIKGTLIENNETAKKSYEEAGIFMEKIK